MQEVGPEGAGCGNGTGSWDWQDLTLTQNEMGGSWESFEQK